ncbi:MAG: DUF1287 domain-containing protein [Pyrinomonadaceae bacterium]
MMRMICGLMLVGALVLSAASCHQSARMARRITETQRAVPIESPVVRRVVEAAIEQAQYTLYYDPAYVALEYPGGDVPLERGVCSDVLVRAFRKGGGVDLQKEVHEDMNRNFSAYPKKWGLKKTDANIDHRRVPNLMTYFERKKKALPLSTRAEDYLPGDVVAWELNDGLLHIGMVTNILSEATPPGYQIVHNIGGGARVEDALFSWKIIGHYRYF